MVKKSHAIIALLLPQGSPLNAKIIGLTALAMTAFAANSVLCRLALGAGLIDAASFASIRVVAGAVVLALWMAPRWRNKPRAPTDWRAVATLFIYMAFFSFAYISLSAGTGALILFGITAPDLVGALLMAVAGIAWGVYSLLGRGVTAPLEATANNFICCVPLVLSVSVLFMSDFATTIPGLALAAISGGITSGIGYAIWYQALKALSATHAATVQLSVPAIAALGGLVFMSEDVTARLLFASAATLSGVWMVLSQRARMT